MDESRENETAQDEDIEFSENRRSDLRSGLENRGQCVVKF
jgi:hypothetical protein